MIQYESTFKGAFGQSLTDSLYSNEQNSFDSRFRICKDPALTMPIVIYAKKDFFLLDALNEKIEDFKAAGLIEKWKYVGRKYESEETRVPKRLILTHFSGCFYVLFIGWGLSSAVVMFELLSKCYFITSPALLI